MRNRYLEVTFRNGKPIAAYLYLPRDSGAESVRTEEAAPGLLVDYAEDGRPIGLEITSPAHVTAEIINSVLTRFGLSEMDPDELEPLHAA